MLVVFLGVLEVRRTFRAALIISEEHMKITIRKGKTDQYRQGNEIVIARTGNKTCPVLMMETYLSLAKVDLQSEEALFRPIIRTKQGAQLWKSGKLSYTRARELVNSALSGIGLDSTLWSAQPESRGSHSSSVCRYSRPCI